MRTILVLAALATLAVLASSPSAAAELPFHCDFDADTPGQPPLTGGTNQPTSLLIPPGGSILVQAAANGLASQPCVIEVPGDGLFGGINIEIPAVTAEVIRVEATVAVNQLLNAFFLQTASASGHVATRLAMADNGEINDYQGTVLGSYTAGSPFRVRIEIDTDNKVWTATIDDELNGFADDPVTTGLSYLNDPAYVPDISIVHASFDTWSTGVVSSIAYDDLFIEISPGTPARALSWGDVKAKYQTSP